MRIRLGFRLLTAALLLSGCRPYDQAGGPAIAEHIRGLQSQGISEVLYEAGNVLRPATILIVFRAGTSSDEARSFLCGDAMPYAEAANPPEDLAIVAMDSSGDVLVTEDVCR
jgi:hypothetical protein